ncbi:MAG: DNA topoisomerase I [Candidatus Aenigmatarchaeota archaeon]
MKQLSHNGIIVPKYEPHGFHVIFKGNKIALNSVQEEMAVAWVRKLGTEYAEDKVFMQNFFGDFAKALGVKGTAGDFDFSEIKKWVDLDREYKLNMPKDEKKKISAERKVIREANKEKYGVAMIDGCNIELGNYMTEPSGIFMGRGQHPFRGKWKEGAKESDIILNLSSDSKVPPGKWKAVVWYPDCMWIARWHDKLTDKEKYVWVSESSPMKQEREMKKFDKAKELERNFKRIEEHIRKSLDSEDVKIRKVATVTYLIDAVNMRVGDEKDEDEADTVGATTLAPKNIIIKENGIVNFNFLGKDSVKWDNDIKLPDNVIRNLREFMASSKDFVFDGVRSDDVNAFLSEIVEGITAKVFRTYHASKAVREYMENAKVNKEDTETYKKYIATMANLQAAIICNHKRKLPKTWQETLEKKKNRLEELRQMDTKKSKEAVKEMEMKIKLMKETKDYNLNTSLKSYVDPRVFYKWAKKVDFDWKKYYSKTMQKKFSWVEGNKCSE